MSKYNTVLQTEMELFQPEIWGNLPENWHFSTFFRTPKSSKTFGHSPVKCGFFFISLNITSCVSFWILGTYPLRMARCSCTVQRVITVHWEAHKMWGNALEDHCRYCWSDKNNLNIFSRKNGCKYDCLPERRLNCPLL